MKHYTYFKCVFIYIYNERGNYFKLNLTLKEY